MPRVDAVRNHSPRCTDAGRFARKAFVVADTYRIRRPACSEALPFDSRVFHQTVRGVEDSAVRLIERARPLTASLPRGQAFAACKCRTSGAKRAIMRESMGFLEHAEPWPPHGCTREKSPPHDPLRLERRFGWVATPTSASRVLVAATRCAAQTREPPSSGWATCGLRNAVAPAQERPPAGTGYIAPLEHRRDRAQDILRRMLDCSAGTQPLAEPARAPS